MQDLTIKDVVTDLKELIYLSYIPVVNDCIRVYCFAEAPLCLCAVVLQRGNSLDAGVQLHPLDAEAAVLVGGAVYEAGLSICRAAVGKTGGLAERPALSGECVLQLTPRKQKGRIQQRGTAVGRGTAMMGKKWISYTSRKLCFRWGAVPFSESLRQIRPLFHAHCRVLSSALASEVLQLPPPLPVPQAWEAAGCRWNQIRIKLKRKRTNKSKNLISLCCYYGYQTRDMTPPPPQ